MMILALAGRMRAHTRRPTTARYFPSGDHVTPSQNSLPGPVGEERPACVMRKPLPPRVAMASEPEEP